jgi:protein TonB
MSERSASGHLAEMAFAPRPRRDRRLQWAGIVAIVVHFLLFSMLFPDFDYSLPDAERQVVVLKKYKPPKQQKQERRPVKRSVTRVPIPDPTPDEPEPIQMDDTLFVPPVAPPDAVYVADLPVSSPIPPDLYAAYDMNTTDLVPPRPRRRVQPRYDRDRARRGVQGSVDIEVVINAEGFIGYASIVNGTNDEELDRLALEAVRQWEFSPAILNEQPVPVRAVVTINFRIY